MRPFYDPKKMRRRLAGKGYSTSEGVWVTGKTMLFGVVDKPAGTGSQLHRHPNEQFIYVLRGRLRANVGGKRKTVPAGGIIHIPANTPHSVVATDEEDVVFVFAKDASWGIVGSREEGEEKGAFIGKGAREEVAVRFRKLARRWK